MEKKPHTSSRKYSKNTSFQKFDLGHILEEKINNLLKVRIKLVRTSHLQIKRLNMVCYFKAS